MHEVSDSGAAVLWRFGALQSAIADARELDTLALLAREITPLTLQAMDEGADVGQTTATISALNDAVNRAVVSRVAAGMGVDLRRACWLVFGSQARSEQTIATDQDNGLIFESDDPDADRPRWMEFGRRCNAALADCGYPLCSGSVMAGQPLCCLVAPEWCARFEHWLEHGRGSDLFGVRLYFDLRPLAGRSELAAPVQALLHSPAAAVPRFLKQMADSVLRKPVPLNWLGRTRPEHVDGHQRFDLKMSGTALFVDAARLWALEHALPHTGTAARLRAAAPLLRVPAPELEQWLQGFHALQRLRLQVQRRIGSDADPEQRCQVDWAELDADQRRALNRALHAARWVQQRIALDWCR